MASKKKRQKPTPHTHTTVTAADGGRLFSDAMASVIFRFSGNLDAPGPAKVTLKDAVAEQIGALTSEFDGKGDKELAAPPRDFTAYRDAYASAAANCLHDDAVEMLYQRQWVCDDCGRTLNRDDMRRAASKRNIFRSYFS